MTARTKTAETPEQSQRRVLASGIAAVGTIKDTWGLGRRNNRAPNGDYLFGIEMVIAREGHRRRTSKRVHQVPKNRTHLVDNGGKYPVKIDRRDPKRVEIDWDNYKRIDGRKVLDGIVSSVGPVLRASGYRKTSSRTFNSVKEDGLIHVVDFQASRDGDGFTVNVAVYVRELRKGYAHAIDEKRLQESDYTFKLRWRIGQLTPKRGDVWWSYESPEETTTALIDQLTRYALPHLKRYESRALLHAGWKRARGSSRSRSE